MPSRLDQLEAIAAITRKIVSDAMSMGWDEDCFVKEALIEDAEEALAKLDEVATDA